MISTLMMSLFSIFFDLLAILRTSKSEKDLEILSFANRCVSYNAKQKRLREYLIQNE
jgi:hypothetical protein